MIHRSLIALAIVALLSTSLTAQNRGNLQKSPPLAKSRLVVHEWGTFTSMVGSTGFGLEGLQHEEEALPGFVYQFGGKSRNGLSAPRGSYGSKKLAMRLHKVTQKMETPVIYFYTKDKMRLQLRVDFVNGLMTQWFPAAYAAAPKPPKGMGGEAPFDLGKIKRSFLQWYVDLIPRSAGMPDTVPTVKKDDPWAFAREVDACWVQTRNLNEQKKKEGDAYLFYRGLGTFTLPITVEATGGGFGRVKNSCGEPLSGVFALEVRPDGARFSELADVKADGVTLIDLGDHEFAPVAEVVSKLQRKVMDRLVDRGLYEKEARAMVRTWSRSWFRTEGTRILYIVPKPIVSSLLPMQMNPVPHELVRVLVGRLEFITPEVEQEVEDALKQRASGIPGSQRRLDRLGRFLEPHLRRVLQKTRDGGVRQEAKGLLKELE